MNKKGFTLIELLAVIAVLGLITSITIPISTGIIKKVRENNEDVFVKKLTSVIEDYITYKNSKLTSSILEGKCVKKKKMASITDDYEYIKLYEVKKADSSKVTLKDIIESGLILKNDLVNPANKDKTCNVYTQITIYKDSDSVYYFKLELDCLEYTDEISTMPTIEDTTCTR